MSVTRSSISPFPDEVNLGREKLVRKLRDFFNGCAEQSLAADAPPRCILGALSARAAEGQRWISSALEKRMLIKTSTAYLPRLTEWHLRRCLKWINPLELAGVEAILLMEEEAPDNPNLKQAPFFLRGSACLGEYKRKEKRSAEIVLYTRYLYLGIPAFFRLTPVATLRVAFTLSHEIGHNLVARRGFVFEPIEKFKLKAFNESYQEGLVDRFACEAIRRMSREWQYRAGRWLSKRISGWYYVHGMADWDRKDYKRAAYHWFCAFYADRENDDAIRGWQQAVARVKWREAKSNKALQLTAR